MSLLPQFPCLSLLVVLPLAGALLCLLHGRRPKDCRGLALATALAGFVPYMIGKLLIELLFGITPSLMP